MADTALKFGPEWLRALTSEPHGGGGDGGMGGMLYTAPLANVKLAEFRYGKEEILALFDKTREPPEELVNFGTLFVEKCQFPLSMMQMSEDESRAWQRGANSEASQRPFGASGKRPPSPTGGRGRGRGRGSAPYYDRNRSMDEELLGGDGGRRGVLDGGQSAERGFPRGGRNGFGGGFERQTSERGGGFFDRNQPRDEDSNGVSPRKLYTRAPFDDWRRGGEGGAEPGQPGAGAGQEADGWRTSGNRRWGGAGAGVASGQGWRTERENYNRAKYGDSAPRPQNDRWKRDDEPRGGFSQRGGGAFGRQKSQRHENSDHLPEWATDDPSEGGTFDTEGKFRAEQQQQQKNGVMRNGEDWTGDEDRRWEDEEVDPEDVEEDRGQQKEKEAAEARGKEVSTPSSWESPSSMSDTKEFSNEGGEGAEEPAVEPHENTNNKNPDPGNNNHHLETLAGNLVASLVDEDDAPVKTGSPPASNNHGGPPPASVPSPPPASHTWSYLDPQGQVQGPFQSDEMFEWYSAGYFPGDLMLRRNCDQRFVSLKDLMKLYNRVPFTPGPSPPPLLDNAEEERLKAQEERLKQQQLQQQLLQQQQLLMQQQMMVQQQQQHHGMMGLPGHHPGPDLSKLLQFGGGGGQHQPQQPPHHGLGSLGLGDISRGYPDPRFAPLGSLGGPSLSEPPASDPLKQLLARSQAGPTMPGLGRPFGNNSPPLVPQPQDPYPGGLFGNSEPPPISLPFSNKQPPVNNPSAPPTSSGFDPIQSLLAQLQGSSQPASPQLMRGHAPLPPTEPSQSVQFPPRPGQSIWDMPAPEPEPLSQAHHLGQEQKPMTSIWNKEPMTTPHHSESPREMLINQDNIIEPSDDTTNDELDQSESNSQEMEPEPVEPAEQSNFVKTKANEKKDKKSKKAEEKRKAKEAKKAAESAGPYIPGMSGTVRPEEQIVATGNINDLKEEEKIREQQEAVRRQRDQMEALAKLQEDQKLKLEREEMIRIQQEKLSKLAPWAKKESSPLVEHSAGPTLQEIQRLEAERERRERQAREAQEARIREEQRRLDEQEQVKRQAKTINWATAAAPIGGKVKSLAEIQAEEARVERERQEQEMASRSSMARANKQLMETSSSRGAATNSIWGGSSTSSKSTWAGKIAANTPATPSQTRSAGGVNAWSSSNGSSASSAAVVAPAGFWDPVIPDQPHQMKKQVSGSNNVNNNNNTKNKKRRDEDAGHNRKQKSKNDFEDWCSRALSDLQAQVDIPTFLGFLMDIESPYDVHDYVKSYVGEGKAQKKFATDYLERRSRWKNSLKGGARYEDDLTVPASALSPGDGEFQEAGKKGKSKKLTKQTKSKQDISHLLGFSVQGQGVNRGELDMPQ